MAEYSDWGSWGAQELTLTIEIKNRRPIELADLTQSLLSFADEFKRNIEVTDPEASAADVKLYIKEIRTGSVLADLIAVSPQLLQGVSYANAVWSFAKHLKGAYEWLTGRSDQAPELDRISYENLANIVEPIAKDNGAQLNVGVINGPVTYAPIQITINSTEANAAQNAARRQIEQLNEPASRLHEKVVLYWYQARADASSKAGDRGIIESISSRPVKVICATDSIKSRMILDDANPFKYAYVVDVMVETVRGRPAAYKIISVHERISLDES